MNVSTSSLLTLLSTKIDKPTKQTIEKLSVDGKVDISALVKEKSVQTLLNGLFKDLSSGVKNKNSVNQLLVNSKQTFDFKNLSSEVKNLTRLIEQNPKLERQTAVLKEFLLNIKNIDENVLKSNIKNSGLFLESKLLKSDTTISQSIKAALSNINQQINLNDKTTTNTKLGVQTNNIEHKTQNITLVKQEVVNSLKITLSQLQVQLQTKVDTSQTQTQLQTKADTQQNIKLAIQNITNQLQKIETSNNKIELPVLKELSTNLKSIDINISKDNILNSGSDIKKNIKLIMSNIQNQLDNSKQTEQQPKNKVFENIKNVVILIEDKLDNAKVKVPQPLKIEIKAEIAKVLEQIKNVPTNQPTQKNTEVLKNIENSVKNIETKLTKIDITNSSIPNNSILNSKSIVSNDLKAVVLQIQEQLETKTTEIPKEVKIQIDKIQTQIEFYQLLSYSSTSNHTFLPFSWEDLDDADIKFDSKSDDGFSCQINLSLKEKGELKVLLQLDSKNNININIGIESLDFKQKIQQNLQNLRSGINKVGLIIQSLNVFDIQDKETKTYEQKAYGTDSLNFGLDIKA